MNQRAPVWGGAKRMRVASAQFRAAAFHLSGRGFSDSSASSGTAGPRSSRDRSRPPASSEFLRLRVSRSEPDGSSYGWSSVHRVSYETRHLYLHETCERERRCRDRRPAEGGPSSNPSVGSARATPWRAAPPGRHDGPPEIRLSAGAPVGAPNNSLFGSPRGHEGQGS